MGKRVFLGALCTAMLLIAAPGATTSYAAGEPAALTVPLEGACLEGQISADSTHFVCTWNQDSVDGRELYSVPIDGSAPATRLSPALFAAADHVSWFDITADGTTVVFAQGSKYLSDEESNRALYSVPIGGGEPTLLTPQVVAGDLVWKPELAPDGSRVVFWWYNETEGGLHSVLTTGEDLTKIADPLVPQLIGWLGAISPDSSRVLYYTYDAGIEANSVPITGGASVKLGGPNTAGGSNVDGVITPDSSHLIYRADHDTAGVAELYAVPLAGGEALKLNHSLGLGESVGLFEIVPDSSGVLYSVIGNGEVPAWYLVPIFGGTPVAISPAIGQVQVAPDSSTVLLDNAVTMAHPLDGAPAVQLANRGSLLIAPDSSVVWIWQNDDYDKVAQLYSVPVGGGALELHPGAEAPTEEHDGYLDRDVRMHITPDSSRFVYAADTDGDGTKELMVVPANGGDAYQLAADVFTWATDESDYSGLFISPDSGRVVYQGDPFGTGVGMYSSLLTRHPEVADSDWYAAEDQTVGSWVGAVDGSDPDGDPLTFAIVEGDDLFDIDTGSGVVTLGAPLDYETAAEHQLVVEVGDGKVAGTALVTIEVGNVNDNPPGTDDLVVTVAEDVPAGMVLGTVDGHDPDGDAVEFSLPEPHAVFNVDAAGVVTLIAALDYGTATTHEFTVAATDGVFTDTATVTINVTQVAAPPPTTTTTIPPPTTTPPPPPEFGDVSDTNLFHQDIIWLATEGITKGCNPPINSEFCPDDYVTRGQMAAFLHRALGNALTVGPSVSFTDDDDNSFEIDIEWLASVGITKGCNPPENTMFCPEDRVTRGQMAAFLDRALDLPEPDQPDLFVDDDDSPFEAQIERLAASGITKGCNPPDNTEYCPDGYVTRGQMAAFLHRAFKSS